VPDFDYGLTDSAVHAMTRQVSPGGLLLMASLVLGVCASFAMSIGGLSLYRHPIILVVGLWVLVASAILSITGAVIVACSSARTCAPVDE
jgi:hypothetical protein